ncbi:DUF4232 domain-containing protein [Streptomyces sp. NPDC039016]|uniref:hypothetical protein n=1 Tax=Streptomyces sp. NPDC039016 TaxID=3154330 RepID=UPI003408EF2E
MKRTYTARLRRVALTAAAGAALAVTVTACGPADGSGSGTSAASGKATNAASNDTGKDTSGSDQGTSSDSGKATSGSDNGKAGKGGSSSGTGSAPSGGKKGHGQTCGANDLTFSASSRSQAGGYILLSAHAKAGITCTIPGALPSISFGSKGIEAQPAEQSVGPAIELSGSKTVYAGINPKTTKDDNGIEFNFLIAAIGNSDPNPVSVTTGAVKVDKPIVTNWHTSPDGTVPGDGTDN